MFNLIRKDLIIQKVQLFISIALIVFFAIFARHLSPAFIFLMASIFIPLNAYTYDEQVKTNILLNSLPYSRKEIIAAKYIGSVIYMILSIGAAGIILYVFDYNYTMRDMAIGAGLFFVFAALTFPLFYVLKPGYIGTALIIGFVMSAAIIPPIVQFLAKHFTAITDFLTSLSAATLYLSGAAISIGLYLISWMVSQFIYQRKAF